MKTRNWLKDVLLCCVVLAGLGAIAAYLLASDRVKDPENLVAVESTQTAAAALDAEIERDLREHALPLANQASELQIIRRISLALAGTLPSVEELRELEKQQPAERIHWYVSHLLEDQRFADYLAERFARVFVGVEEGPFLVYRRNRFVAWLAEQIHQNVPYDQLTNLILTSDGIWTDKPQVNFYTYNIIPDGENENKPDAIRLAGRTSRAFLGMRIDCLQCHDDFLGNINLGSEENPIGGQQKHFHALASFFSQVENSLVGIHDNLEAKQYQYQLLDDAEDSLIPAMVPFNSQNDETDQPNLRIRLANWITHRDNRAYARAAVNRVWAVLFGRGLVQPVDNIPLEGPFPAGMEMLVDDFVANGYDLHRLIRVITSSQTFQRASSANFEILPEHHAKFAVFPMVRLRPEQVAGAIIQSTSLKTIDSTSHIISRLIKFGQENDFVSRFGDQGEDEFDNKSETITQRLLMMNGEMVRERLTNGINSVTRIALLSPDSAKAVETIYLATLCRLPTAPESEYFTKELEPLRGEARTQKVVDIYWTLINGVEFVWNH